MSKTEEQIESDRRAELLAAGWHVSRVSLYDEDDVDGWRWESPDDDTEYTVIGDWDEPAPVPEELMGEPDTAASKAEERHTPGNWVCVGDGRVSRWRDDCLSTLEIASFMVDPAIDPRTAEANARRAMSCFNACEGLNPEAIPDVVEALKAIIAVAGNLPDERMTDRTGPNDAAARGLMVVNAREIARTALAALTKATTGEGE